MNNLLKNFDWKMLFYSYAIHTIKPSETNYGIIGLYQKVCFDTIL